MPGVPANFTNGPTSPSAFDAFAIAPSDTVDLAQPARALFVAVSGDVSLTTLAGTHVTFQNVAAGLFPVAATRVWATGTTATGLRGLV